MRLRPRNGHGNRLLTAVRRLEPRAFEAMRSGLRTVTIRRGTVLTNAGEAPARVFFLDSGIASAVGETTAGESLELGFVGVEGVSHVGWLLGGAPPPYLLVAQFPITAHVTDAWHIRRLLAEDGRHPLHCLIQMYAQFSMAQMAQSAMCARFHTATERLARWLLLTATSMNTDAISLTHEAVGDMVGAPRSQVSEALGTLRRAGCLTSKRGLIRILDREKLRRHACECFDVERARLHAFERRLMVPTNGGSTAAGSDRQ